MLRARDFCSPLHRKKYGDRLGKALHKIAAPDPAPAGIADFLVQMPFQQGNLTSTLILWQTVNRRNRIPTRAQWPLTIATSDPAPIPECAPVECPPPSGRWMAAPPAEPVAA